MQKVKKIAMIILKEHDLAAAVNFYQELGFRLIFHLKNSWAELELAGIKLGLCPVSERQETRTGLVFEVEDLHRMYEQDKEKLHFLHEPKEAVHGIMASIQDPGGNSIDLYQPTPEKVHHLMSQAAKQETCCKSVKKCCKS